jgi:hypothetical protein
VRFLRLLLALFIFCITVISCQKEQVSYSELLTYIKDKDNRLNKTDSAGGVVYNLEYRPTDLLVWQELGDQPVSSQTVDSIRFSYGKFHYYLLNISVGNQNLFRASSREQFSSLLNEVSFNMQEHVFCITDKQDTIQLADFNAPRLYELGSQTKVLLAFERGNKEKHIHVCLTGFDKNRITFIYKIEDINRVPLIKYDYKQ